MEMVLEEIVLNIVICNLKTLTRVKKKKMPVMHGVLRMKREIVPCMCHVQTVVAPKLLTGFMPTH